ncbi:MAG TPA: anti-sigma factor [Tepidisphaeraceae bacterium]|jgi:anti-sigma factor RsiW|nr:anti-sigma factor [Tepidisphaeraceae bacterium]
MNTEQFEFLLSQQLDGTLSAEDSSALQAHLATAPGARRLADEYQNLNSLLKSFPPVPAIDYRALASRINDAIDNQYAAPPIRLNWNWTAIGSGLAMAACMMLAVGLWMRPATGIRHSVVPTVAAIAAPHIEVAVLQPEDAKLEIGPALQRVSVGPPVNQSNSPILSEAIVSRPNTLFIAKADQPAQDTSQSLY